MGPGALLRHGALNVRHEGTRLGALPVLKWVYWAISFLPEFIYPSPESAVASIIRAEIFGSLARLLAGCRVQCRVVECLQASYHSRDAGFSWIEENMSPDLSPTLLPPSASTPCPSTVRKLHSEAPVVGFLLQETLQKLGDAEHAWSLSSPSPSWSVQEICGLVN